MDLIDRKILRCLQEDVSLSLAAIAERVGLSTTPCWRRIQKLEQDGVILGRVALLDPEKLNLGCTVFVRVLTSRHSADWLERFAKAVAEIDEVVEEFDLADDKDNSASTEQPPQEEGEKTDPKTPTDDQTSDPDKEEVVASTSKA